MATKVEFEILQGSKIPVLRRNYRAKLTDHCPYCGKKHRHGTGDGHRIAHCAEEGVVKDKSKIFCILTDDTIVDGTNGYILKTY